MRRDSIIVLPRSYPQCLVYISIRMGNVKQMAAKLLRDQRHRVLNPHTLSMALVDHCEQIARVFVAVGTAQEDQRWLDVAADIRAAAAIMRRSQLSRPAPCG